MSHRHRLTYFTLFAVGIGLASPGCLSLGGKTTYVTETTESSNRISALESRVSALEQALGRPSPPPVVAPSPGSPF